MIDFIISILFFIGLAYLSFVIVDYFGNKFFNVKISTVKKTLLVNLCLISFILAGFVEMSMKSVRNTGVALDANTFGPLGYLSFSLWTSLAWSPIMVPIIYLSLLTLLLLVLKIYRYTSKESEERKTVSMAGLLIAIFLVVFGSGVINFKGAFEETTCGKLGDSGECYYELGVKTNDISFCEKIKEESKYKFYASDCYYEIALNTKDFSLCKNVNGQFKLQSCFNEITKNSVITNVATNAITEGKSQFCIKANNQREADRCHYNFVEFYYDDVDLYLDFYCYGINSDTGVMCYNENTGLSKTGSEKEKENLAELFLKLCDNIVDENLRNKCYLFKKSK